MNKINTAQAAVVATFAILLTAFLPFIGSWQIPLINSPIFHYLIQIFSFLLAGVATLTAIRLARRSYSTFFIPVSIALLTNTFDHLIQSLLATNLVGINIYGSNPTAPGVLSIGVLITGFIILFGSRKPQRVIQHDVINIIISYTGPALGIIMFTACLITLTPVLLIPTPHFPGTGLPVWEYLSIVFLVTSIILVTKYISLLGKPVMILIYSLVLLIISELYMSASLSIYDTFFSLSAILRMMAYAVFVGNLLIRDIPKEASLKNYSFAISRQMILLLITFVGLQLVLVFYHVRAQLLLNEVVLRFSNNPVEIMTRSARITNFGLLILGVTVTSALTSFAFIISRIRRQFFSLTQTVRSIESGNLGINIETYSDDEFGELASALDRAVNEANSSTKVLADHIKEKTQSLSEKMHQLEQQNEMLDKIRHDLTMAHGSIKQENVKTEAMLRSIGEGVIVVDTSDRIQVVNQAALDMLDWNFNEVYNTRITETLKMEDSHGQYVQNDKRPIALALAIGRKTASADYIFSRSDETKFPVFVTSSPIMLDGTVVGAIEVFRDITKEKEVDQAKSEFVSLASHQLRTPLTAISWFTESLITQKAGPVNDKQREYLNKVYDGNQKMIRLVNGLLNVSRIELGTFIVDPQPTQIWTILDEVLDEVVQSITQKQLTINKLNYQLAPTINLDAQLITIICQNLVTNAVKYTPASGTVTIDVYQQDDQMVISIADTGYGIPQSEQSKIFTKMYRATNVRNLIGEGTGLGLYIIKSVLEKVGGRIWFESEENKGTTFYVALPLSGMESKGGEKRLV